MYAPVLGRYKVYIIDEVHMLSTHSFNAFLKTLEEPPEHVKFILATTDPKKLPITVLSRCLQFNLRHATQGNLAVLLQKILQERNINYDKAAVNIIARQANGSIRDLLSITEQVIALDDKTLSIDSVELMLGNVSYLDIVDLINLVIKNNSKAVFEKLNKMLANNIDFSLFLEQLLEVLHNLIVIQHINNVNEKSVPEYKNTFFDYISNEYLIDIINKISPENLQFYYQTTQLAYKDLEFMPDPFMVVEMAFLRMLAFYCDFNLDKKQDDKNVVIDSKVVNNSEVKHNLVVKEEQIQVKSSQFNNTQVDKIQNKSDEKSDLNNTQENIQGNDFDWVSLVEQLNLRGLEKQLIEHLEFNNFSNKVISLNLSKSMSCLLTTSRKQDLESKISNLLKYKIKLDVNTSSESVSNSIAAKNTVNFQKKQQSAIENIKQDPHVKELVNVFDAKINFNNIEFIDDNEK